MKIQAIGNKPECHAHRPSRTRVDRRSAFSQFALHHQKVVYNLAYRILGDPELAATTTEETLRRAFPVPPKYHGRSTKLGLMRIAIAVCQEQLCQAQNLNSDSCEPLAGDIARETVVSRPACPRSCEGGQDLLDALPPDQRVTLVLADIQDLSYREIAEVTGVSVDVIRSQLSQGRAALRDALLARVCSGRNPTMTGWS